MDCASSVTSKGDSQLLDICLDIEIGECSIKNEPMSPESSCTFSHEGVEEPANNNSPNGTVHISLACTNSDLVFEHKACIKNEPMSSDSSCPSSPRDEAPVYKDSSNDTVSLTMPATATYTNSYSVFKHKDSSLQLTPSQKLLHSQPFILISGAHNGSIPQITIKSESNTPSPSKTNSISYGLPLTPPSSNSSDGSESNLTSEHMLSSQPPRSSTAAANAITSRYNTQPTATNSSASSTTYSTSSSVSIARHTSGGAVSSGRSTSQPLNTPWISIQPKASTSTLLPTEEPTSIAEGSPIPENLPLTKAEEKSLKKIRRQIKNRLSAQKNRLKKKEYVDQLERRIDSLVNENNDYKKRVKNLEDSNASLLSQLHKLQDLVNKQNLKKS